MLLLVRTHVHHAVEVLTLLLVLVLVLPVFLENIAQVKQLHVLPVLQANTKTLLVVHPVWLVLRVILVLSVPIHVLHVLKVLMLRTLA